MSDWYKAWYNNKEFDMYALTQQQIDAYEQIVRVNMDKSYIEGVMLTELRQISDQRGAILHMLRADLPLDSTESDLRPISDERIPYSGIEQL